jgi:nitrogen regulatory protein P-II 1
MARQAERTVQGDRTAMFMMVEALIRPQKAEAVRTALVEIGVKGITITEVCGSGRQRGLTQHYRGAEYTVSLIQKVKFEVVVPANEARVVARTIADAARTGEIGDGKIFLIPVGEAVRIRTGEEGRDALE